MHQIRTRPHSYILSISSPMITVCFSLSAIYLSIQLHCHDSRWCFCSNFLHALRDNLIWNRCGHQHSGLCWKLITYQVLKTFFCLLVFRQMLYDLFRFISCHFQLQKYGPEHAKIIQYFTPRYYSP